MVQISKHALFQDPPSPSHHRHHHVFFSALQREENLDGPLRGSFPGGGFDRFFCEHFVLHILGYSLLTEHYVNQKYDIIKKHE